MTTKQPPRNTNDLIDYKFSEVFKRLDRMEQTMNGFAFVKQVEFDKFTEEVRDKYVKKEDLVWVKNVIGGISIGVGVALVIAFFKIVGARI